VLRTWLRTLPRCERVVFGDSNTTITANNIGILCNANAGYVLPPGGSPGNVTGNTAANIVGCAP
jgi:hypothetical protein